MGRRAGRRRGTTTATLVNRFAFLFLLFLARDRSFALPVWFAHVHLHARSPDGDGGARWFIFDPCQHLFPIFSLQLQRL